MEKTGILSLIKPKDLEEILARSSSMLEMRLLLRDAYGNALNACGSGFDPLQGPGGGVSVPIVVRGDVLGSLVGHATERFKGERLREVLGNVADSLTERILSEIKLDSMSEELLHNYKVLNLFYNVSSSLVNILNVRRVSHVILNRIVDTIGLSKASVLLLDQSRKNLIVVAHKGLPDDKVENTLFPLDECVCKEAVQKAKPLFVQDIDHYPGLKKRSRGTYRSKSFISVPILKSGPLESQEVLGVINVADKLSGDLFYSGDMKLIMALTSLAAMSIQNATYFEEVERIKEEWESTFDAITDSVAIIDTDYRLCKVNNAYNLHYQFSKEALFNKTCYEVFYGKEGPCLGCPVTRTLLTGEPSYAEKRVGKRIFRHWAYPIHDERGGASSVVIYTRDVTHLKTLKERLAQSERMASIGQIAAGMAHEIRNPLGSIVTAVDVLSSGGGANNENFTTLSEVLKVEAKRLNQIISEFLLYAAPQKPLLGENDLGQVVREVLQMIAPEAKKAGIRIETKLDPAMGPALFDADKIKQVVWNIVLNGIQAMEPGGTLWVATGELGDAVRVSVKDQGPGIRKGDRGKIFDPFYTTKASGTGLGLSVVSRIIEDHQGRIEIRGDPGRGAEFILSLPSGRKDSGRISGGETRCMQYGKDPLGG